MRKERFEELLESVREAGAVLRGEAAPSREFQVDEPPARRNPETYFAVCLQTDDPELLVVRKIYEISVGDDDLVRVIDEKGEAAIYPRDFFMMVEFSPEVERALARTGKRP